MATKKTTALNIKAGPVESRTIVTPSAKTKLTRTSTTSIVKAETTRINASIEKTFHEKIKKFAAKNQLSLSQLITKAIKEYMKK